MLIRKAEPSDIPALCALERECFSLPWSEKGFEDFFANDCSRALAAEADGRVVGYVGMYLICGEGEITNLAVAASCRRQGIGEALMTELSQTEGLERLLLDVRQSNTAARALYEKCGFKVDGIRRRFYEKPAEDAVLMSRTIEK
ncbi:MAG: ribosomal protein S18-alanine N-acetyltransferase [Clostridia bacterium]|nr:ribosomal protein S18-alanine N-acetyltransferase [Clostridia bacterium]